MKQPITADRKTDLLRYLKIIVFLISVLLLSAVLTLAGSNAAAKLPEIGYENRLFDDSKVHSINIMLNDPKTFFEDALNEVYYPCDIEIDGETFMRVGIRAKGNNSLQLTEKYGHNRYSLKLEMDHYLPQSYHGLDKFSLDASFQDNSYLKTYLAFDMMRYMEVPTPLCSYVNVTINGDPHGLFLAVEEPEEAFAKRNFGADHGQLYKPDYRSLSDANTDVALQYTDDSFDSYDNIFRNAKFIPTNRDKQRLIRALKILSAGEHPEDAVNVDEVLRYFTVQVFVVNLDNYLGKNGHNYFLYEENGKISILPWDYNLAFGTYSLGMPDPINDPTLYVNHPIDTPASGEVMLNRPLYHNLMLQDTYFAQYRSYFDQLIAGYFESGSFAQTVKNVTVMIDAYVKTDPTAFCSYQDYLLGVDTISKFCLLRAESIRGQLDGSIPSTIKAQSEYPNRRIDASMIRLEDMGEIEDLKNGIK